MGSVLLIELPPKITSCLRERLSQDRFESVVGQEAIATALARAAGELDAVIVGPGAESQASVAEQAGAADPDLAVIILCCHANHGLVKESLRFSPLAGTDVQSLVLSSHEPLADLVTKAVTRTRQRRRHRSLLAASRSELEGPRADPPRFADEIRESEERFRMVVERVNDPIVTIEADGLIHSTNPALGNVFGYTASELVGQPITMLMPESLRAAHSNGFTRYLRTHQRSMPWTGMRIRGRQKNGREIPLELSCGEFALAGRQVFTGVFHDRSAHERVESELRDDAARLKQSNISFRRVLQEEFAEKETLERLAQVTVAVDSALSLEQVLESIYENFSAIIAYDRIACALLEDDRDTVRSVWVRSDVPATQIPTGYSARLEETSLGVILESGLPRIIDDLEDYLRMHPDSQNTQRIFAEGMRSSLTCPLVAMGRSVGLLFFSSMRPHTYKDSHVETFVRIAEQIAIIVERGRLWEQLLETKRELEVRNKFIAEVFGRYTSDSIASQVLGSPEGLSMGGETRTVSILFADLRGFTSLCAMLDPQQVVRLLNIHLAAMTDVIMSHGGTIDEFMGDGILVIFGAPTFIADHAGRAVACAIAMQRAMKVVAEKLSQEGLPPVEMGIAVHTGTVVAGNIGSEMRAKYGIVGSAVNLVTRIESFTDGGQILCSGDTLREAGVSQGFEAGPVIQSKNAGEAVPTYAVRDVRAQPAAARSSG
jgi:PAS domain S-box-containing protein